ncbi:MAG: TonB-dependent receptor plug domain-containing protein [Bacteroidales bacterium]
MISQTVVLHAEEEPLNLVLIRMAREHNLQISFDDQLVSGHRVTVHREFDSSEDALGFLLKGRALHFEKIGPVYVIEQTRTAPEPVMRWLTGQVQDRQNGEGLPFAHLLINGHGLISDFNGRFSFQTTEDSVFHARVSYLGYFVLDTVLASGPGKQIGLTPSLIGLEEVVVEGEEIDRSGQVGEEAGLLRLNHKVAYRLPGSGDNALFDFLRLQPGVLAAGEQSSEMMIWGSYSGHSQMVFDGITVFGLKNFNDNISFVNPYMAKDIRVMKGGFDASYGQRVGGIVEVSGVQGSTEKPSLNMNINNMTLNGMASFPVTDRAAVVFAYRHTYYDLYDSDDLTLITRMQNPDSLPEINVYPEYVFRDVNLKLAGSTERGDDYYVSAYDGRDHFGYDLDLVVDSSQVVQNAEDYHHQSGASVFYGRQWQGGAKSHLRFSASHLDRTLSDAHRVTDTASREVRSAQELQFTNTIGEFQLQNRNDFVIRDRHHVETGWSLTYNRVAFTEDSFDVQVQDPLDAVFLASLYVQDEMELVPGVTVTPGIRSEYAFHLRQLFLQPRIQMGIRMGPAWRITGAWGLYRQFITETSIVDDLYNIRYFWAISDGENVPVLEASHLVGGVTYHRNGLTVSLEGYHKTTLGITREFRQDDFQTLVSGQGRSYGMDMLVKKYFGRHEIWASYSLSKTEESFPIRNPWSNFPESFYRYAPQDQRHELKGALLMNFRPLYLSANYVYGSGFNTPEFFQRVTSERYPYKRLDLALIYRYSLKGYHVEAGVSLLNVFNTKNIKYSNTTRVGMGPESRNNTDSYVSIAARAIPFTPTLFLNLSF